MTMVLAVSSILLLWAGGNLVSLLLAPVQRAKAPELLERLEGLAFYMMEELEDQGARPDRHFDFNTARARADRFHAIYIKGVPPVNAAAVGMTEIEDALVRAHEWMARVDKGRLRLVKDVPEAECRQTEAEWRANGAQAVVEFRSAAINLHTLPVDAVKAERKSRVSSLIFAIALGGLILAGAIFAQLGRKDDAEARSQAKPAVNSPLPSAVESSAVVAVQYTREAILTLDPSLRILTMNPAAEALFGYRPAQAMGLNLSHLLPSLSIKGEIPDSSTVEPTFETGLHASGKKIPVEISLHLLNQRGRRTVIAVARNAANAAAQVETPDSDTGVVADMARLCPAPLVIYDPEGRVVHINEAFGELLGIEFDDCHSQPYWKQFLEGEHSERARREWLLLASKKLPDTVDQTWRRSDGSAIPMVWARSALRDPQGRVRFIVAIGVERNRAPAQRRAA